MIVLIGAQRVARSTSHYSVDWTTIVTGPSKLLLETDNARSITIVAVAAVITAGVVSIAVVAGAAIAVAVIAVAIVAGAISITRPITRPIPVVTGAISIVTRPIPVTVGRIAIAVRIKSIAIWIAKEREAKAAYENEIIKVAVVVVVMPIAAIPISAIPMAVPIAAVE